MKSVVYYCNGPKPHLELLVSMASLRRHYDGDIVVCFGERSIELGSLQSFADLDIRTILVPGTINDNNKWQHWGSRWRGLSMCDSDQVLHPDCDTIIKSEVDSLFGLIHPDKEYITSFVHFNDGRPFGNWERQLKSYRNASNKIADDVKPIYFAFGMVGWNKGWPHFMRVHDLMKAGMPADEMAMNVVLLENGRKGFEPKLRYSVFSNIRGYYQISTERYKSIKVWHFPSSCNGFSIWWEEFMRARENKLFDLDCDEFVKSMNPNTYSILMDKSKWPTNNFVEQRPDFKK